MTYFMDRQYKVQLNGQVVVKKISNIMVHYNLSSAIMEGMVDELINTEQQILFKLKKERKSKYSLSYNGITLGNNTYI